MKKPIEEDDDSDCQDEKERRAAADRLTRYQSWPVLAAMDKTMSLLEKVGIRNPPPTYLLTGGRGTIFLKFHGNHSIEFTHQSECAVFLKFIKNNRPVDDQPVLWAPTRDPWVIIYLVAGYFGIKRAVFELHKSTTLFCKYGHMRTCSICGIMRLGDTPRLEKIQFRLTPLWSEDDVERAIDKSLNLAKVAPFRSRLRKLYYPK